MALREVLLGLLVDRPDHGYSLKRRLSPGLPDDRLINDGVLYPLLRRMQAEGLIDSRQERDGGRIRRRFSTTERGRTVFLQWLACERDEDFGPTYELYVAHPLVKLLFSDHLTGEQRLDKLAHHADCVQERLRTLECLLELTGEHDDREPNSIWLSLEIDELRLRLTGLKRLREGIQATCGHAQTKNGASDGSQHPNRIPS